MTAYDAAAIEVLSGLEPVRKRPGMYTDTTRPNHLAQEVVDNSVDEAIAGHARRIDVRLFRDGSVEVSDDGRGMPVDTHPQQGIPGVEVILTKLHAGGKFSDKSYQFSGGLHGVGVSVVNALSKHLEVWVKRGGTEYNMAFANGQKVSDLEAVGTVGKTNTGTRLHFWPDPRFFDSAKISVRALRHLLRAKAVLCPGLHIRFFREGEQDHEEWCYEDGLRDYLVDALQGVSLLPEEPFVGSSTGNGPVTVPPPQSRDAAGTAPLPGSHRKTKYDSGAINSVTSATRTGNRSTIQKPLKRPSSIVRSISAVVPPLTRSQMPMIKPSTNDEDTAKRTSSPT